MPFPGDHPMKRLSKEKRTQLIIVVIITLAVLGLIGFGLIQTQYDSLTNIAKTKKVAESKLQGIRHTITNADEIASELSETSYTLTHTEEDMASGDLYSWTYDTIRRFKQQYKVEIPEVGHPSIGEMDLLPSFPYKQIRFAINGTAYYHDLGKFIADFENNFPHARVVHLVIEPVPGADSSNEKLSFRMEIIALVKLNPS
jgi:hypothetical protein